jgi:pimeloyl-ACP methyl ester carboxylesterase
VPATLAHVVEGSGPPLLLLNGGLMSLHAWDPVARALAPRFRVVRCDLRGQLLSPGPPPPTLEGHAADLAALLDRLGVASAHVAGASFGALVGLTLAARHGGRVRSVAAITATDRIPPETRAATAMVRAACRAAAAGGDGGAVFDLLVPTTFSPRYRREHADDLAARRQVVASLPRAWFDGLDGLLQAIESVDLRPLLPAVGCPVLVLAAGEDLTFPLPHSRALAAALPGARLHVVPHAAHGLVVEAPDLVAEVVAAFASEVERRSPSGPAAASPSPGQGAAADPVRPGDCR